jgi:hypothetical protein
MKAMSNKKRLTKDEDEEKPMIPPEKPKKNKDKDDDPVPVVDARPDYAGAMKDAMTGVEVAFGIPFGGVAPAEFKRFAQGGEVEGEGIMSKIVD